MKNKDNALEEKADFGMQIILNEEIPIPFVTVASSFQIRWT